LRIPYEVSHAALRDIDLSADPVTEVELSAQEIARTVAARPLLSSSNLIFVLGADIRRAALTVATAATDREDATATRIAGAFGRCGHSDHFPQVMLYKYSPPGTCECAQRQRLSPMLTHHQRMPQRMPETLPLCTAIRSTPASVRTAVRVPAGTKHVRLVADLLLKRASDGTVQTSAVHFAAAMNAPGLDTRFTSGKGTSVGATEEAVVAKLTSVTKNVARIEGRSSRVEQRKAVVRMREGESTDSGQRLPNLQ